MTRASTALKRDNGLSPPGMFRSSLIEPQQMRAARGYLDWSRDELAAVARISPETIRNIESGIYSPQTETLERLLNAFAGQHIQFFNLGFLPPYIINGVMRVTMNGAVMTGEQS